MTTATRLAAVVVVGYRSAALLERNLAATDLAGAGAVGVVVDNSDTLADRDATRAACERHGWRYVGSAGNTGFGDAVNRGAAAAADAEVLVLLNPDARLDAATLTALVDHVVADPGVAVSPQVVGSDGRVDYRGSQWRERDGAIRGVGPHPGVTTLSLDASTPGRFDPSDGSVHGWLTGACLAVHRDAFAAAGGFETRYFLYWEDVDFSDRLVRAGIRLQVRLDLTAVHDEGGTHGGSGVDDAAKSDLYHRWNCRNRLVFAAIRLPRRTAWRWVAATPARSTEVLLRGGRRALLTHPAAVLAALRGSVEGVGWVLRSTSRPAVTPRPWVPAVAVDPSAPVTVAVLTFHRPDELARVLPEVVRQADAVGAGGRPVTVVVVDNDAAGGAADVVAAHGGGLARHVVEPVPGIAAGRNRALDEAGDGLLVFVDDDEVPRPGWLEQLLAAADRTGAAGVAGPVVSRFDGDLDPWIAAGGFFARRHRDGVATDDVVAVAASNNLLLRLAPVRRLGLRFDAGLGAAGGEDTRFTSALTAAGERIVWCREAVVDEFVPRARMTRRYAMSRAFTTGNAQGLMAGDRAPGARRVVARAAAAAGGVVRVAGGGARAALGGLTRSTVVQAGGARTLARGAGMVLGAFGVVHRPYRRPRAGRS